MKQATNILGPSQVNDSTVSTFDTIYLETLKTALQNQTMQQIIIRINVILQNFCKQQHGIS